MSRKNKINVGISIGDVAGIGPEIIMKTFMDDRIFQHCTPVLFANPKVIGFYRKVLDIDDIKYSTIRNYDHLASNSLNISLAWEEEFAIEPGSPSPETGKYALKSLDAAVSALKNNQVDVLVTAPINKHVIQQSEFQYPGHTEYLQNAFERKESLMFMVSDDLKIGVVTGHVPLSEVSARISTEAIVAKLKIMDQSLKEDFGIDKPKIAVLGLNPHAGDNGTLGEEEQELIVPAVSEAKKAAILVNGPYAADGFFGNCRHLAFDGILAMYHDQGLIPFKYLAGESGINFTAGLPIVRTSPDHGTAEDIAGKGKASPESFRQAIYSALDIHREQVDYSQRNSNPLQTKSRKSIN